MDEPTGIVPMTGDAGLKKFAEGQRVWTSLDVSDPKKAAKFLRAKAQADFGYDDVAGQNFNVTDAILHDVNIVDDDSGEVKPAVRTVLICDDGSTVAFVSKGIVSGLRDLWRIFGAMPWQPARTLTVLRAKAKRVGHMYILTIPE